MIGNWCGISSPEDGRHDLCFGVKNKFVWVAVGQVCQFDDREVRELSNR